MDGLRFYVITKYYLSFVLIDTSSVILSQLLERARLTDTTSVDEQRIICIDTTVAKLYTSRIQAKLQVECETDVVK